MEGMRRGILSVMVWVLVSGAVAHAAGLRVCVRDEQGEAVSGAQVLVRSTPVRQVTTDETGCVALGTVSAGTTVEVAHAGFATAAVKAGDGGELSVVLRVAAAN